MPSTVEERENAGNKRLESSEEAACLLSELYSVLVATATSSVLKSLKTSRACFLAKTMP
jgi:hypothetical protein